MGGELQPSGAGGNVSAWRGAPSVSCRAETRGGSSRFLRALAAADRHKIEGTGTNDRIRRGGCGRSGSVVPGPARSSRGPGRARCGCRGPGPSSVRNLSSSRHRCWRSASVRRVGRLLRRSSDRCSRCRVSWCVPGDNGARCTFTLRQTIGRWWSTWRATGRAS